MKRLRIANRFKKRALAFKKSMAECALRQMRFNAAALRTAQFVIEVETHPGTNFFASVYHQIVKLPLLRLWDARQRVVPATSLSRAPIWTLPCRPGIRAWSQSPGM